MFRKMTRVQEKYCAVSVALRYTVEANKGKPIKTLIKLTDRSRGRRGLAVVNMRIPHQNA